MHALKKIGWVLTALVVTLVPGVALAGGMGEVPLLNLATRFGRRVLRPSLFPNTEYWYLFLGAMICTYFLFAFFPRTISGKEIPIKGWLAKLGQIAIIFLAIGFFMSAIWLVYELVKGFVLSAVKGVFPSWVPDVIPNLLVMGISFIVNIVVVIALVKMLGSVGTYQGVFGALKSLYVKFTPTEKNQKLLAFFGMLLFHALLARMAHHLDMIWPMITVSVCGILVTIYHFAFEQKVVDTFSIRKTGLTEDGKILCRGYKLEIDEKGKRRLKPCNTKNEPGAKFCRVCEDPLGVGATWDCEKAAGGCGKQNIPIKSETGAESCDKCGMKRPQLERANLTPEDVKRLKKDSKLAKKGKRVCLHCGAENLVDDVICDSCEKDMRVTPRGVSLAPPSTASTSTSQPSKNPTRRLLGPPDNIDDKMDLY